MTEGILLNNLLSQIRSQAHNDFQDMMVSFKLDTSFNKKREFPTAAIRHLQQLKNYKG